MRGLGAFDLELTDECRGVCVRFVDGRMGEQLVLHVKERREDRREVDRMTQ